MRELYCDVMAAHRAGFLITTPLKTSVCQRGDLPKIPEWVVGGSSIRVQWCDGCIVSCRHCCTQRGCIGGSVNCTQRFRRVSSAMPANKATYSWIRSSSSHPRRFIPPASSPTLPPLTGKKPRRSNKSPSPQVVPRISASSRVTRGNGGRGRAKRR